MDNVEHAWTIDGRIVCLLRSGKKETVVNESELSNPRRDDWTVPSDVLITKETTA